MHEHMTKLVLIEEPEQERPSLPALHLGPPLSKSIFKNT